MKPPLTVEAKVAEELRTWLSSELELLNASNTNQFAHHVVTIFLHEGLDIEDEPLSKAEHWDIFEDISSIKKGKTIDNQKKAAVQFLRSAVYGDSLPVESDIKEIIEELMVKIAETKHKMKTRSVQGLLVPIKNNAGNEGKQNFSRNRKEKYNEAFPSLSGEKSPKKCIQLNTIPNSVWTSTKNGKENMKQRVRKSILKRCKTRHSHSFSSEDESQACSVAMKVAASCLPKPLKTSPEVAEITQVSKPSLLNFEEFQCWKSAFLPICFTKTFSPIPAPLKPKENAENLFVAKRIPIRQYISSNIEYQFASIMDWDTRHDFTLSYSEDDLEVGEIFYQFKKKENQHREKQKVITKEQDFSGFQATNGVKTKAFPDHYGTFWEEMIDLGQISLYPDFECLVDKMLDSDDEENKNDQHKKGWGIYVNEIINPTGGSTIPSFYPKGDLGEEEQPSPVSSKTLEESPLYRFELQCVSRTKIVDPKTFYDDVFQDESACNLFSCHKGILHREENEEELSFDGFGECQRNDVLFGDPLTFKEARTNQNHQQRMAKTDRQTGQQHQGLWASSAWDCIRQELVTDMELAQQTSGIRLGQPSQFSASLSSPVDEMLQNAFINSLFSRDRQVQTKLQDLECAYHCEDVEKYLYNVEGAANTGNPAQQPFVLGPTCSSWLEDSCVLGGTCPYRHPSVLK